MPDKPISSAEAETSQLPLELRPLRWEKIKAIFMDVDGVLTDGMVLALESGEMARRLNTKDAFALQLAARLGYPLVVISGGSSGGVVKRLKHLGLSEIHLRVPYKLTKYREVCNRLGLKAEETVYIGDDLPDMEVMQQAGISVAPNDAAGDILGLADYITAAPGGRGCVREVLERIMKAHNKWYTREALIW